MTPTPKAEEVAEKIHAYICGCHFESDCLKFIAKALTAYADARVLEAFDNKFKNEHKRCLEIARAEALEGERARIADWLRDQGHWELAMKVRTLKGEP